MRIKIISSFLFLLLINNSLFSQSSQSPQPFVLLELFTSQGCSSCPPADKLLGKIIEESEKNHKPIYALEYHVDYWNKYGWKDPYSSFKYTLRQRNYVSVLPETQAYTPQLIVNGEIAFVGSDEKLTREAIDKALNKPATIILEAQQQGIANDSISISYTTSKTDKNYYLKIAIVEKTGQNTVNKGENAGKTLIHHHIVTHFSSFDLNEKVGTVKMPLNKKMPGNGYKVIAFVQNRQTMKILAATEVTGK